MKSYKIILMLIALLFYSGNLFATDSLTIKFNGHAYKVEDVFSKRLKEMYNDKKAQIKSDIKEEIEANQPDASLNPDNITLPNNIAVSYSYNTQTNEDTLIAFLDNIKIKFNFGTCKYNTKFDLSVKYLMESIIDSVSYKIRFHDPVNKVTNFESDGDPKIWYLFWDWVVCEVVEWFIDNFGNVENRIEKQVSKALIDTTFKVLNFAELANGQNVPPEEVEALENSFTMNGQLKADLNNGLIIEVNFLDGYNGQYAGILPDEVPVNHQLDIGGIAFLHHNLQQGYEWNTTWITEQRIDAAFDKMQQHGLTGCRVEARWDLIQRSNEVLLDEDPATISDLQIDNLINNGSPEWQVLDYILDKAFEKGFIVQMAVGIGHESRPPGTPVLPSSSMAPDNSLFFNTEGNTFVAVSANDYLYNLELYSRAVVRRYANRVGVWQIENELNAARFAESFNWWRKGNLWRDDQPGGFQDQVWNTLVEAVRSEDPRSKIIHDFHMFDIIDRLERWASDLDIIGCNFYPNQLFAYPVLGFAVGEYVWALRRVLKGLGMSNKPVWVTETGYPAKTTDTEPDPYTVDDDVMLFSEERQQKYIQDALEHSMIHGADAFYYYALTSTENEGGADTPGMNKHIHYSGLIRSSNAEKQALAPFGVEYVNNYPGIGHIRIFNRYNNTNVGGQVSLKGEHDFLTSGDPIWIIKQIKHTGRTELEKTVYNATKIKHHDWDGNNDKFKMDNEITVIQESEVKDANFIPTNTGSFTIANRFIGDNAVNEGQVQFKDPWFMEYGGDQPNSFKTYAVPFTPGSGAFDWYDGLFLNQAFDLPDAGYYSLKAPVVQRTVHGETIDNYFLNWEGDEAKVSIQNKNSAQTDVEFKDANASVTAVYKGHLVSNQEQVTAYNTARKIAWGNNELHAVYEDNGKIWYTKSTDEGDTWSPEVCISDVSYPYEYTGHYNPSLAIFGNDIYVVWEGVTNANGYYDDFLHEIILRKGDISGETTVWSNNEGQIADNFEGELFIGTDEARPVVCVNPDVGVYIAWRSKPYGIIAPYGAHIAFSNPDGYIDMESYTDIPNCFEFPAIATGNNGSYPSVSVLWIFDNDELWSTRGSYENSEWTWQPKKILNGHSYYDNYSDPSFSLEYGHIAHVTWEAEGVDNNKELWYGMYDLLSDTPKISETKVEDEGGPCAPVISVNGSTSRPTIFYSAYGSIARYKQNSDNSWSVQNFLKGRYPNVCQFGLSGAVWTKYYSAPYIIGTDYEPSSPPSPLPPAVNSPRIREYLYTVYSTDSSPDTGYIALKFNKLRFNNEDVLFNNPLESDTLIAPVNVIPMELEMEVSFHNITTLPGNQELFFKVDFMDGSQAIPLTDLRIHELPDTNMVFTKSITANNMNYREGYLKFSFANLEPYHYWTLATTDTTDSSLYKGSQNYSSYNVVPEEYSLEQNYPNPFNPLTFIKFNLPKEEIVELSLYNTNGQKVKELIKGSRSAGTHQVVFNGSDLASGMYFYRLTAGNFIQVRRMLLIR